MLSSLHFVASKQDLCTIFQTVEQEFPVKYCLTRADQDPDKEELPKMEFDSIEEIADGFTAAHSIAPFCLITPKTEVLEVYQLRMQKDDIARYCLDYRKNTNGVLLKGMEKHEDLTCEFYVHINRDHETEFSAALFKSMIREIKRNCVRVKNTAPTYIGKEMYKERENRIFHGERCGAFTVTAANEAKEWYRRPKVRKFSDKPFREKLSFLQRVFDGKEIKDYEKEGKNFEKFKTSLVDVNRDTKVLVKKILEGLTDKRMAGKRKELADMLKQDLGE